MSYVWEIACGYSTGLMNEEQGQGRVWGVRKLRHGCHMTEPTLGSTTRFPAILASIANPKALIDLHPPPLEVPKEQSVRVFGTKPRFDVADPAPAPGSQVMGTVFARPCSSLSFSDSVRTVQGWTTLSPNLLALSLSSRIQKTKQNKNFTLCEPSRWLVCRPAARPGIGGLSRISSWHW